MGKTRTSFQFVFRVYTERTDARAAFKNVMRDLDVL